MIINGDHLTSAEWDVLGKETGRLIYRPVYCDLNGVLSLEDLPGLRERFSKWPEKPRIFREYEGGEIEITKDVWK